MKIILKTLAATLAVSALALGLVSCNDHDHSGETAEEHANHSH